MGRRPLENYCLIVIYWNIVLNLEFKLTKLASWKAVSGALSEEIRYRYVAF